MNKSIKRMPSSSGAKKDGLSFLSQSDVRMIDDLLMEVSPYGEVLLKVQKGRLRFIAKTKTLDAFKWKQPEER